MKSKIAEAIKLQNNPVAVFRTEHLPENARQFKPGVWGCVIAMLNAAALKGITAAFDIETVACNGGKAGLGLKPFEPGFIEYFLSVGGKGPKPGEHYKKTPELALEYILNTPKVKTENYIVFKPLNEIEDEIPEEIVFLVNADQMSGLATLANYDNDRQDNVRMLFGAGCMQSVLYGLNEGENGKNCYVGLTDPSARKCIAADILSFSIPYCRFLEMEENVSGSFLETDTWKMIMKRI